MRILALDISSRTGWASAGEGLQPACGTWRLPSTGNEYAPFGRAYERGLKAALADTFGKVAFDLVVYEAPIMARPALDPETGKITQATNIVSQRKLSGLCFLTEMTCEEMGVDVREAARNTVLKHFLGKAPRGRKERKIAVMTRAKQLGWDPIDDNAADAIAILDFAAHVMKAPEILAGRHFRGQAA